MSTELHFYVYVLRRPDGDPFYVGMGSKDRIDRHEIMARRGEKSHRANIIRQIWASGGSIGKEIVERFKTAPLAKNAERQTIAAIGRRDLGLGPLVNRTDGGDGVTGWSADMRTKHSTLTSDGMKRPDVQEKVRANIRRQWENPATAERMLLVGSSYWKTPEARAKQSARVKAELADLVICAERAALIKKAHAKPETKKKLSDAAKNRMATPGRREAHIEMMKRLWATPGFAEKRRATFAAKRALKAAAG